MLFRARGVILRMMMFPKLSSCSMTSTSARFRSGIAFRKGFFRVFWLSDSDVDK
jgi:hypothetical protein